MVYQLPVLHMPKKNGISICISHVQTNSRPQKCAEIATESWTSSKRRSRRSTAAPRPLWENMWFAKVLGEFIKAFHTYNDLPSSEGNERQCAENTLRFDHDAVTGHVMLRTTMHWEFPGHINFPRPQIVLLVGVCFESLKNKSHGPSCPKKTVNRKMWKLTTWYMSRLLYCAFVSVVLMYCGHETWHVICHSYILEWNQSSITSPSYSHYIPFQVVGLGPPYTKTMYHVVSEFHLGSAKRLAKVRLRLSSEQSSWEKDGAAVSLHH